MKSYPLVLGSLFAMATLASPAQAKPAKCLIQVNKVKYLDGICNFEKLEKDSFTIGVGENGRSKYFAYVYSGTSYWNEDPNSDHAHTPLPGMYREGACMRNKNNSTRLCAWER